jgi:uncharacterized membrane-anchored protein
MRQHELRHKIIEEMHLRRWPRLNSPCNVVQIVRVLDNQEREEESRYLAETLSAAGIAYSPSARHVSGAYAADITFAWERHTEGSSITVFDPTPEGGDQALAARHWAEDFPGRVVRATRISVVADEAEAESILPRLDFSRDDLVSCRILGRLRMWSDFQLHEEGFGRLVIAANGADPATLSRAIQQLQELGNYRNMALLGLPEVREQWNELDEIEGQLRQFAIDVGDEAMRDDVLLERVSEVAGHLATLTNRIGYRLNATRAYAKLVDERLEDLQPEAIESYHTLAHFIRRRFLPAVRTCDSHRERLDQINARTGDLASLLRARISTRIENQNAQLLESLERRAEVQLRLQQLVEGLSIFALAYYGVGLVGYVLGAIAHYVAIPSTDVIKGVSVPVVMFGIWLMARHLKRRILGKPH